MSKFIITLIVLISGFATTHSTAQSNDEIRVGLMTELTGPWVAGSGELCKRGYELARKTLLKNGKLNGREIRFIYGETQGIAKASITEFNRLIASEKVHLVVTNRSQVGMAINPISKRTKTPLIGIVGHNNFVSDNPYAFRTWPSTKLEGQSLSKAALKLGHKRIAIVALEDEWTISFRDEFVRHFEASGGEVVLSESFVGTDTDFSTIVTKIKSIDIDSILVDLGPTQTGSFLARLHQQQVKKQLFGNYYTRNKEVLKEAGSEAVEGLIFSEVDVDKPILHQGLKKHFNDNEANQYKYTCYAGVRLALAALEDLNSIDQDSIYQSLATLDSVDLFGDNISIIDRELLYPLVVKRYKSGEISEIE